MSGTHSAAVWLRLDRNAQRPLAEQIVTGLRTRILDGELRETERLPSSRALAEALGVARSVVVRAYEQLLGEGYLEARAGSGTTVAAGIVLAPTQAASPPTAPTPRSAPAPARPERSSVRNLPRAAAAPDLAAPIDLRTGHPFAAPTVPEEWRRAVAAAAREPMTPYAPPPLGDPRLREQIALHVRRARGIDCVPDDVIVTGGTADALLLLGLALGAGSRIAMEDPGYPEAAQVLSRAGATVDAIPVRDEGLTAGQLDDGYAAVLVTPSHQFPLGGRMPATERTALVAWAAAHGSVVIEDDYDSEFRHTGAALPAIAALDGAYPGGGIVAHIGSLNKSFSPSLRCGYLIAASGSRLHTAVSEVKTDLGSTTPALIQSATTVFFASGGFRRYVARTRREYRHRRALLLDRFAAHGLGDRLSGTDGGLHAVLRLPQGRSATELAERLVRDGVLVERLADFRRSSAGADDAIAIGYGAEPALRLERGVDAVIRAVLA